MKKVKLLLYLGLIFISSTLYPQSSDNTYIEKWAKLLVNYSINLQPNETIEIRSDLLAQDLCLAVYKEAILKGAHPKISCNLPGRREIFLANGNEDQLKYTDPINIERVKFYDVILWIEAPSNTKCLNNIDPIRMKWYSESLTGFWSTFTERMSTKELRFCYITYPTNALAQEAEMSLNNYKDFVYSACLLDKDNPVKEWEETSAFQRKLCKWLKNKDKVIIKGKNINITMSIQGRDFLLGDGKANLPDGEIYVSPIETSAEGWVNFTYPAIRSGREVKNVQLWFKKGKVVKSKAEKGEDYLNEILNTDEGAKVLGELGIGTNYNIKHFSKNILYDEKLGGTIHLAVGRGFPEGGGKNKSAIHWDMLCDMSEGEIIVDGELFYKNGQFVCFNK